MSPRTLVPDLERLGYCRISLRETCVCGHCFAPGDGRAPAAVTRDTHRHSGLPKKISFIDRRLLRRGDLSVEWAICWRLLGNDYRQFHIQKRSAKPATRDAHNSERGREPFSACHPGGRVARNLAVSREPGRRPAPIRA